MDLEHGDFYHMIKSNIMKYNTSSLLFILTTFISFSLQAKQIPFNGNHIEIIGSLAELNINEGNSGEIDIKHQLSTNPSNNYKISHNGTLTTIELLEKQIYSISIPNGTNISCKPIEVAMESDWYKEQNNYRILLRQLTGEVIIDADGYDVFLDNVSGPTSVVTYGDIKAKYNELPTTSIVSLDTYQGNITLQLPSKSEANIKANAKNGVVIVADELSFDSNVSGLKANGNVKIITANSKQIKLHTEDGKFIKVDTIRQPTHPELKDKLIKLFIRDQGKKTMATGSRTALIELGYEDYINQQPDIRPFVGNTLVEELDDIIETHGFPTPEMVGDGFAMKSVMIILMNNGEEYMKKYEDDFIKQFGKKLLACYYQGPNGRKNKN